MSSAGLLICMMMTAAEPSAASAAAPVEVPAAPTQDLAVNNPGEPEIEYLVPELKGRSFKLAEGKRAFRHKLALSPAAGRVGDDTLFALRFAYNPNEWLGWEAAVSHTTGDAVHALFHTLSAQLRYPVSWRIQPYGVAGFGMFLVFPGNTLNAGPATRNALSFGGGAELYLRNDMALRGEMRGVTILGTQKDMPGTVAYNYQELSLGFVFYRTLNPGE